MGDAHHAGSDSQTQPAPPLYATHVSFDPLHDHDFSHPEFESVHQSLSPLSMHVPGTLSRPASMTSMTLPPQQTLSRVSSLSNLHNWQSHVPSYYMSPVYLTPGFQIPGQAQTQQNYLNQAAAQQNFAGHFQMGQYGLPPNLLFGDFMPMAQPAPKPLSEKNPKKPRARKAKRDEAPMNGKATSKHVKVEKKDSNSDDTDDLQEKQARSKNPSSIYRGVSKCSKDGRWQARIRVKRQVTYLGRFVNEIDAAKKYDEAARIHHGDKAILNFPTPEDEKVGRKQAVSVQGHGTGNDDDDDSDGD